MALPGLVVFVVVAVAAVLLSFSPVAPVIAGFVVSVPYAVHYLRKRHDRIGTP
jgi:ABC-type molybdate transport system permease subunit